jgi:hypothetical protein
VADLIGLSPLLAPEVVVEPSLLDKLAVPIIGTIGMIIVGALTLIGTFRSSGRTAQVQRDNALDERADRQNERLTTEVTRLTGVLEMREKERDIAIEARDHAREQLNDYRERYAALRIHVRNAGLDPDTIGQ